MEPLYAFLRTLARILITTILLYTSSKYLAGTSPYIYALSPFQSSILATFLVVSYAIWLYPTYFDPLRILPRVTVSSLQYCVEY